MTTPTRLGSHERKDLDKLAARLGSCALFLRAEESEVVADLTVSFEPISYESGEYEVSVGLIEANLRLEHDGHEIDEKYGAMLADEFWKSRAEEKSQTGASMGVEAGVKAKFWGVLSFGANAGAKKNKEIKEVFENKKQMPLIEPIPIGWRIGGEQGDPRWADQASKDELENCLRGAYFQGQAGERPLSEAKAKRACVLRPKDGSNVSVVRASLYGAAGALRVAVRRKGAAAAPQERSADDQRAERIKRALIEICVARAGADQSGLSGETFLHQVEKGAPKLAPAARSAKPK